jgi:hypothetical protein
MSSTPTASTSIDAKSPPSPMPTPPKHTESNYDHDDNVEMRKIVITLKNTKVVMEKKATGKWQTIKSKPKNFYGRRKRIGSSKLYAEMSRRKKRFESTAFGRLRKKHRMELHHRAYTKMDFRTGKAYLKK